MSAAEFISKYKPIIIIILLFTLVFALRAEAANLSSVSDQIKPIYQDDNGVPYFSEMDSYYNYRLTQDYLDHGYLGDTKINGTNWDLHSYYPPGRSAEYPPLIVYLTAFAYKFLNIFANIPLTTVAFWMGAFVASLCVIPAYLFVRRITNDYGGIVAGILAGIAPAYFSHTFAGFFDTDMFNVLLPLLVVWFFVESVLAKDLRSRSIFATLSAISMLIFSMAWEGWWYIFYLVIVTVIVYLLVSKYLLKMDTIKSTRDYTSRKDWLLDQPEIFALLVFFILSSLLIILTAGFSGFSGTLVQAVGVTNLQATVQATSYPNVFVSVAELQVASLLEVIANVGGYVAFAFGILGVIFLFIRLFWPLGTKKPEEPDEKDKKRDTGSKRRKKRSQRKKKETSDENATKVTMPELTADQKKNYLFYAVLFSLWLLLTGYAITKGVRFVETFSVPIALSAGIFVGLMVDYLKVYIRNPQYHALAMVLIVILVAAIPVYNAYAISSSVTPGTDDYMANSLTWIKGNTPQNTVITSWWDFGHLFAAKADRAVTFDGGSQNSPRAYWVGKALVTNNESLSAGILRMLASSGDAGYQTLDNYTKNTGKSVEILNNILGLDKQTALTTMTTKYGLTSEQAQNVLKYTHPDNPTPDVLITSSDMLGKAVWWSYFGNWNFQTNQTQRYNYVAGQAVVVPGNETGLNSTILIASNAVFGQINGNTISAGVVDVNQIQNNTNDSQQFISKLSTELQKGNSSLVLKPHKLIVVQDKTVTQNQVVSADSQFSIAIIKDGDSYMTIAFNKELEDSMFTQLYLLRGQGLSQFKLAYEQQGVMVWNVSY
jgi:dolichyl-phosphooligosaccharide-protein glycotransferase